MWFQKQWHFDPSPEGVAGHRNPGDAQSLQMRGPGLRSLLYNPSGCRLHALLLHSCKFPRNFHLHKILIDYKWMLIYFLQKLTLILNWHSTSHIELFTHFLSLPHNFYITNPRSFCDFIHHVCVHYTMELSL